MGDQARYMRAYRRQPRDRLGRRARQIAQQRLLSKHEDEYRKLVEEARRELGIDRRK